MKIKGIIELCFQTAKTSSLIIGGWIATFNYELGYGISILINVLAIISALSFKEPTVHLTDQKKVSMLGHIKGSIEVIRDNAQILNYVVFIESFSLFHTTLFFYFQNFLKGKGFSETWIGVTLASASLLSILFSTRAHWFEEKFGRYRIIRASAVATLIALAGIAFLPMEIAFFIMISCIDGVLFVAFSDYINQLIPSEHRATLLSFQAMVFSLLMILYFPVFGWVASSFGFKAGFIMVFFTSVPLMGFTFLRLKNTIRETEKGKEV